MNHQEALRELAVERYLLGELSGASLDSFEEHLFECRECAADVKNGATFIDAARSELGLPEKVASTRVKSDRKWSARFLSPWVLVPALAACLVIIAFQAIVLQPRMELKVAQAQTPTVLNSLVLANAGARSDSIPEIVAPAHGSFVMSVDVPTNEDFSNYRCSLYAPDGVTLWETTISPEQARDALLINMPTAKTKEGLNVFFVQGLTADGTLKHLAKYKFRLKIQNN